MKFSIEAKVLAKAMKAAASILESTAIVPICGNVRLVANGESLEIATCDLDSEYRQTLPIKKIKDALATTVDAKRLLAIANAAPADAVLNLSLGDGRLTITAGRGRWVISTLPVDDFPAIPVDELGPVLEIAGPDLASAIRRVEWAIYGGKAQPHLMGIWLHNHDGKITLAAAQGSACAVMALDLDWPADAVNVMIASKFAGVLADLADGCGGPVKLAWDGRKVRADLGDCVLTGKLVDSQFVEYRRAIPDEGNVAIIDPDSMAEALKRVLILAHEKSRCVKLTRGDSKLTLNASDGGANLSDEEVPSDCTEGHVAGIDGQQLAAILSAIGGDSIEMHQADATKPFLFRRTVADGAMAVIMPMRI